MRLGVKNKELNKFFDIERGDFIKVDPKEAAEISARVAWKMLPKGTLGMLMITPLGAHVCALTHETLTDAQFIETLARAESSVRYVDSEKSMSLIWEQVDTIRKTRERIGNVAHDKMALGDFVPLEIELITSSLRYERRNFLRLELIEDKNARRMPQEVSTPGLVQKIRISDSGFREELNGTTYVIGTREGWKYQSLPEDATRNMEWINVFNTRFAELILKNLEPKFMDAKRHREMAMKVEEQMVAAEKYLDSETLVLLKRKI